MRFALVLLIAGAAAAQPPAITPGEVFNAASFLPQSLPGGKLSPGMRIVVKGVRFIAAGSETTVEVSQGSARTVVHPNKVAERQLEMTLPASIQEGEFGLAVINSEGKSRVEPAEAVRSAAGIETTNGRGWGPAADGVFPPGSKALLHVNGLNEPRPRVWVAGVEAKKVRRDGTRVTFEIPRDAPGGCWTPVWIESSSGALSNFATLSISGRKESCTQAPGWFARRTPEGHRQGVVALQRIRGHLEQGGPDSNFLFDSGAAFFFRSAAGPTPVFQMLPPASSCLAYGDTVSYSNLALTRVEDLMGSSLAPLRAGKLVTIEPKEGMPKAIEPQGGSQWAGFYAGFLGGMMPRQIGATPPPFFTSNPLSVTSDGGEDVGPFQAEVVMPPAFHWTGMDQLQEIDRKAGVELGWSNFSKDRQMVVFAASVDIDTSSLGVALCVAPPGAETIRIPPYALANFPATGRSPLPLRFVLLASIPATDGSQKAPAGLDELRVLYMDIEGKVVRWR